MRTFLSGLKEADNTGDSNGLQSPAPNSSAHRNLVAKQAQIRLPPHNSVAKTMCRRGRAWLPLVPLSCNVI